MLTLPALVGRAAERDPDATALVDGERRLSYAELETRANQLSALLHDIGVRRGDRVGVHMDKSAEAVVGVYGVMKAGAAYVPMDPNAPSSRLAMIAADCDLRVSVTGLEMAPRWAELLEHGAPLDTLVVTNARAGDAGLDQAPVGVRVHTADSLDAFAGEAPADRRVIDRDLAYILYTSGSTGRPKGVMVSHHNCLAFVSWAAEEFGLRADDQVSQFAPLIFDLSTFDLYATALVGGAVHLVRPQTSLFPKHVHRFLTERAITVVYAVPSLLTMLLERGGLSLGDLPALRTVLFAGEVFPTKHLSALMGLLPHATFANLYGPTETNVCTFQVVDEPPDPDGPPISIGRTIDGDEGYVVRDDGSLAGAGEEGELWIRGGTVMQGYWGDLERTRATLVRNPFLPELGDPVYRTGDIVVRREDDSFTLIGRRDNQVKRRGYRIELGEIETAVLAHAAVRECAVTAVAEDGITREIVAHVVGQAEEQELASFCLERIPRYMLPDRFMLWPELPKTPTGKIDRFGLTASSTEKEDV